MPIVDGGLLRQDREDRQLSREAFLELVFERTGLRLSVSTLRRAESGTATRQAMRAFAQATGFPVARYESRSLPIQSWKTNFDLNGEWLVYYLEDDIGTSAYICTERLFVKHDGSGIRGIYEPLHSDHPGGYQGTDSFVMEGFIFENMIMGRYYVDGRAHPRGAGVYQLMLLRNGAWAEGACTFYGDDGTIMVSVNFWIKRDSPEFAIMKKQVDGLLSDSKILFSVPMRRKG